MSAWHEYKIPFLAVAIYFTLWVILAPLLGYLMDSDAVAYLTIAHRAAAGDWAKSVNGLWSPLNSWLLIPFINAGVNSWLAAKVLNCFFGGMLIIQSFFLFRKLKMTNWAINFFTLCLSIIMVYYVYFQMFGDVLQLIFALAYVHLFISDDFPFNTKKVLLASIIMGVAYYAKSYSLVFFILHFTVLVFLAWQQIKEKRNVVLRNYLLGILTIIIVVLPWSFQLQKKYGAFSLTGFAGKLNISWYINSGKTFNDSIVLLIPPTHEDSPSFWEDPYLSSGKLSTPFSSMHHFGRWLLRVGHTALMALKCISEITLFFIPIIFIFLIRVIRKKILPQPYLKLFLTVCILPIGYLTMHIETRYIWLLTFLIIALGFWLIESFSLKKNMKHWALVIFGVSFCLFPIMQLSTLSGKNKDLFVLADKLKAHAVKGKLVSNINDEGSLWVVSYLSGIQNYTIEQSDFTLELLISEMKRYGIKQYLHYEGQGGQYNKGDEPFKKSFKEIISLDEGIELFELKN